MGSKRKVTEEDLRIPSLRDARVEDLEFRDDGVVVRKDRWERGIRNIASRFGIREFEVSDIEKAVHATVRINELALKRIVSDDRAETGQDIAIGGWLSAALDDPSVCTAMKNDIRAWFCQFESPIAEDVK